MAHPSETVIRDLISLAFAMHGRVQVLPETKVEQGGLLREEPGLGASKTSLLDMQLKLLRV